MYDSAIAGGAIASAEMYNALGAAQIEAGMYDKALQLLDQGIALGDQAAMGDLMYNKAVALEYSGEFSRALDLFLQYKASYGSDAVSYTHLDVYKRQLINSRLLRWRLKKSEE